MSKLLYYREKLNLTQEELSNTSGISVRTIQRIEAGTIPKGHTLKVLSAALEIKEIQLLEKNDTIDDLNYTVCKLINLSSLLFVFIPPINILLPLLIMFFKKQFNPLTKQLVSLQILWTVLMAAVFLTGSMFSTDGDFVMALLIFLMFGNAFIILRNAAEIDKNKRLYIKLNFSII